MKKGGRCKPTGLVQVYTGNGKGKTTAALGLCMRAAGHGLNCCIIQFMKGVKYGELEFCKSTPKIKIFQFGRKQFTDPKKPTKADIEYARKALKKAEQAIKSKQYDIVVLDEINIAVAWKLVDVSAVLQLIAEKPSSVELVLTGRYAEPKIIKAADLVTEMVEVKHPYKSGVKARAGIEY